MSLVIETDDRVAMERLANGGPVPFGGDKKAYIKRLRLETWSALRRFFGDKPFHAGGRIPTAHLMSEQNFRWVASTPFSDGIDLCHQLVRKARKAEIPLPPPPIGEGQEGDDEDGPMDWYDSVSVVVQLLNDVRRHGVPPHLQAGVMVLYFKLCMGVELPEIDLDITHLTG